MKYFKKLAFSLMLIMVALATASQTFASSTVAFTLMDYDRGNSYNVYVGDTIAIELSGGSIDVYGSNITSFTADYIGFENVQYNFDLIDYDSNNEVHNVVVNQDVAFESAGDYIDIYGTNGFVGFTSSYLGVEFDTVPVINGETAFVTNVDNPISETTIRSYISAYDETDGNITHLIQLVSDNYSANKNTLGSYVINYSVTDSAGNTATLAVTVLVKDVTAPTSTYTTNPSNVSISYTQTFNIEAYKLQLGIADNYYDYEDLTITVDYNEYTASKTIPGVYGIDYLVTDPSGNESIAMVNVTVIDDVNPVISGPVTLTKNTSETLTESQIRSQLTANDVIDGSLTSSIQLVSDAYTGHGNVVGSYDIVYSVTDASGNIAYHTVTVTAVDNIPPVFYVADGYFITVEQSVSLTLEDFKDILIATGQLDASGTGDIVIVSSYNEYFGHENEPGIYALTLTGSAPSGDEFIWNLAVEVLEGEDQDSVVVTDNPWYIDFYNEYQDIVLGIAGIIVIIITIISFITIRKHIKKAKRNSHKRK